MRAASARKLRYVNRNNSSLRGERVGFTFLTELGVAKPAGMGANAVVLPRMNLQRTLLCKRTAAYCALRN